MVLDIHLENKQEVYYSELDSDKVIKAKSSDKRTTLMEFFDLCSRDEKAKELLYIDVPTHYSWNKNNKTWLPRKNSNFSIGRMYNISIANSELFYLRMLLNHVKGPTCFKDLRLNPENLEKYFYSYREAVSAQGLIKDSKFFEKT
ncbi:UNVERIFIED_CONTAM: hypothetical protein RMT77_010111 [Armadillidium vulgare]